MACSVYKLSRGLSAATLNSSSFHPVFSIPTSLDSLIFYDAVSGLSPKSVISMVLQAILEPALSQPESSEVIPPRNIYNGSSGKVLLQSTWSPLGSS